MNNIEYSVGRLFDDERWTTAVYSTGSKHLTFVSIDCPIRLCKRPIQESKFIAHLPETYTVRKVARRMLQAGRKYGISKGARIFLQSARRA